MKRLENKTAIITGSTSGIGRATAKMFAQEGAKVAVVGRNEERGEAIVSEINEFGGEAFFVQADLCNRDDARIIVKKTLECFGRIDILMNNAGIMINGPFESNTEDDYTALFNNNFRSYLYTMWEVLPLMRKQKSGSVINIASIMFDKHNPGVTLYSACKAAINQMTRCLALEYSDFNVRLNVINPGPVRTAMVPWEVGGDTADEVYAKIGETVPLKRVAEPEDIAALAVYLASDESSFVTASAFKVDGGIL